MALRSQELPVNQLLMAITVERQVSPLRLRGTSYGLTVEAYQAIRAAVPEELATIVRSRRIIFSTAGTSDLGTRNNSEAALSGATSPLQGIVLVCLLCV